MRTGLLIGLLTSIALQGAETESLDRAVAFQRLPDGGIQPQVVTGADGMLHLLYFKGDAAAGDLFYVRRNAGETAFSEPIQVNTHPGSAIAIGTIRGGQLAIGKAGRPHVVWNGSQQAQPRGEGQEHDTPLLYTRLNDAGTAFEPERNVVEYAYGLDGGGSVAADQTGNVYVVWHANPEGTGEANRRVYLATSRDNGKTFARETAISPAGTGVCGCCGLDAFVDPDDRLLILYRAAREQFYRDMYLLVSADGGATFQSDLVDPWQVGQCPMSSVAFAASPQRLLAGWETAGQVLLGRVSPDSPEVVETTRPSGGSDGRKHPAIAVNQRGESLFVWTEGTGWNRGGRVAWQGYNADGTPNDVHGTRDGIPVWSFAAVIAGPEGGFTIIY